MAVKRSTIASKPWLVGQAPSVKTDGQAAFSGRSGRFLAELLGVEEIADVFEPRNLIGRFPGKIGGRSRGDKFPMDMAVSAALAIEPILSGKIVVFAGRQVAEAFGFATEPILEIHSGGTFEFLIIPHPSGVVRWWNKKSNRARAKKALMAAIRRAGENQSAGGRRGSPTAKLASTPTSTRRSE